MGTRLASLKKRRARVAGVLAMTTALAAGVLAFTAPPASAAVEARPDLTGLIPPTQMRIETVSGERQFRYTHDIANQGDGPLEIRPEYDAVNDNARGFQRIYNTDGTLASERPVGGQFIYHAIHGHYHYPLAAFGLYNVKADGSVGAPVVMAPKVGFCVADSIQMKTNAGPSQYSGGNCSDPRKNLGITVGWADEYDYRDDGQSIPIDGLADGTYWFRSVVDPDNFLVEKNEANNITDVKIQVTGNTVTVLQQATPAIAPPAVTLTNPVNNSTLTGTVKFTATASDPSGVTKVDFLVDGVTVGVPDTAAPFELAFDTNGVNNGSHLITARAWTGAGLRGTSPVATVNVVHQASTTGSLALDVKVFNQGTGTVRSSALTTATAGETLVALVSSDGQQGQTATVTGGGLTWTLARRTNTRPGTSEVWTAKATGTLTNATFTSAPGQGGYVQTLTVLAFQNSGGIGATAAASAQGGTPAVPLTTSRDGGWVFGAGNDWDVAEPRVMPNDQMLVSQFADGNIGDTLWAQATTQPSAAVGTIVNLRSLQTTTGRWNMVAVEVLPAGPATPGPVISNVLVGNRTATTATVTWTTDVPATSQVQYGTTTAYGVSSTLDATKVTSHSVALSGLAANTQYHYRVLSTDAAGNTRMSGDQVFSTPVVSTLSVAITAPTPGASITGTQSVTADASGTASVSGVQFKVDGTNLGAEDVSPPYAVNWDTTTVANGLHTLTAIARDPTGNTLTSTAVTVSVANVAPPAPSSLVAAYSFNAGSGTIAVDGSGKGNTGTLAGATWATTGRYGKALSFNGTNARVNVPDNAMLRLSTAMTLEAWVNPTTTDANWRTVLLREVPGGLAYGLYSQTTDGRPAGYVNTGGSDIEAGGTAALAANTWTHLAVTYDGAMLRIFRNGVQVGTRSVSGSMLTAAGALRIGGNAVWGEWFRGLIDEVRIYNKALTAAEITTDMNTALT